MNMIGESVALKDPARRSDFVIAILPFSLFLIHIIVILFLPFVNEHHLNVLSL